MRACARTRLTPRPAFRHRSPQRAFDGADERVLERKTLLAKVEQLDARRAEFRANVARAAFDVFVHDDVQTISKERDAPRLNGGPQDVGRFLRLVHPQLEEMTLLASLDLVGASFDDELAACHQSKPIALFRLVEIVRRDEHGRAVVGKLIDERPQRAPRERIDARRRFVEKENGAARA